MMHFRSLATISMVAFFGLTAPPAKACSLRHISTAVEITRAADVIVRAMVVASPEAGGYGYVKFEIVETLKGDAPAEPFTLFGQTDSYFGKNDNDPPYDFVRPGGRRGNCFAKDYNLGAEFLLFLKGETANWAPLAATNEEVTGPDDPWVLWVKSELLRIAETSSQATN